MLEHEGLYFDKEKVCENDFTDSKQFRVQARMAPSNLLIERFESYTPKSQHPGAITGPEELPPAVFLPQT